MLVSARREETYLLGAIEAISALVSCQQWFIQSGWEGYRHRCDQREHEEPGNDSRPDETSGTTAKKISTGGLVYILEHAYPLSNPDQLERRTHSSCR